MAEMQTDQPQWPAPIKRRWFESERHWQERRAMWATTVVIYWSAALLPTPWIPQDAHDMGRLVSMVLETSDPAILNHEHYSWCEPSSAVA